MTTVQEIMDELKSHGSESIKKILLKHGVKEPFFGVKIEYMKPIQKKIKMDYQLAKDLYATGNADAMYLAGLIADDQQMTKTDLQTWVKQAVSNNISEYTVPWVATGSNCGYELALEWIDSPQEYIAAAGWSTLSNLVSLKPDDELDISSLKNLLLRVGSTIHSAGNRVRSAMNGFIIAVGSYVSSLTDDAVATAKNVGPVTVNKEGIEYITKAKNNGTLGKKKKTVKC
jgi:3-methyladenine DNA glycosylase AlkD